MRQKLMLQVVVDSGFITVEAFDGPDALLLFKFGKVEQDPGDVGTEPWRPEGEQPVPGSVEANFGRLVDGIAGAVVKGPDDLSQLCHIALHRLLAAVK